MGNFHFRSRIPAILLSRLEKLSKTTGDPQLVAALNTDFCLRLKELLGQALRTSGPTAVVQKTYWRARLEASPSGAGLPAHSEDTACHRWISPLIGRAETTSPLYSLNPILCRPWGAYTTFS